MTVKERWNAINPYATLNFLGRTIVAILVVALVGGITIGISSGAASLGLIKKELIFTFPSLVLSAFMLLMIVTGLVIIFGPFFLAVSWLFTGDSGVILNNLTRLCNNILYTLHKVILFCTCTEKEIKNE